MSLIKWNQVIITSQATLKTCLADFGTTYIGKNSVEVSAGSDDIKKNHTIPVSAINVDNEVPLDITEQLTSEQ